MAPDLTRAKSDFSSPSSICSPVPAAVETTDFNDIKAPSGFIVTLAS